LGLLICNLQSAICTIAHGFGRLERPAAYEHAQPPEQRLLLGVEQVVAPVDRRAQGLLADRQVARAAGKQREPAG
jgi:hypothetical protein